MNTLSYFFPSRTPAPAPTPTPDADEPAPTPTQDDSPEPAPAPAPAPASPGDTIYLSARRAPPSQGGRIEFSLSSSPAPARPGLEPLAAPVQLHRDPDPAAGKEEQDGEKRLAEKRDKKEREEWENRRWLTRLAVGLYLLVRNLLGYLGLPSPSSTTTSSSSSDPTFPTSTFHANSTLPEIHTHPATPTSPLPTPDLPAPRRSPSPVPRPPLLSPKTLVLDLDETLIHSTSRPYPTSARRAGLKVRAVEVVLEGRSTVYTVYKRPWVDFFLRKVSTWYTVIIFTASLPEYADPVIDWLDGGDGGGGMVGGRLFRSDCRHANGSYVKDLSVVDADLSRVCLVDNSPSSYAVNQANGIPIAGWINDPDDECLLDLLPMLDSLRFTSDVRRVLGLRGFAKA